MSKELRRRMVKELVRTFQSERNAVLVNPVGLTGVETAELRGLLREDRVRMRVVKNSVAVRAFREIGWEAMEEHLQGPVAILHGAPDPVVLAKSLTRWAKKHKDRPIPVRCGRVEGTVVTARQVAELAKLPTRQEMLSHVLATVIAPMTEIAGLLQATLQQVPNLVQAHIEKLEKAGTPS